MVIGETFLDEMDGQRKRQQKEQKDKPAASIYLALCSIWGKKVARRQILAEGWWACRWNGLRRNSSLPRQSEPTVRGSAQPLGQAGNNGKVRQGGTQLYEPNR
jgi:hypothetical protein